MARAVTGKGLRKQLEKLKVAQLREICIKRGVNSSVTKPKLIDALLAIGSQTFEELVDDSARTDAAPEHRNLAPPERGASASGGGASPSGRGASASMETPVPGGQSRGNASGSCRRRGREAHAPDDDSPAIRKGKPRRMRDAPHSARSDARSAQAALSRSVPVLVPTAVLGAGAAAAAAASAVGTATGKATGAASADNAQSSSSAPAAAAAVRAPRRVIGIDSQPDEMEDVDMRPTVGNVDPFGQLPGQTSAPLSAPSLEALGSLGREPLAPRQTPACPSPAASRGGHIRLERRNSMSSMCSARSIGSTKGSKGQYIVFCDEHKRPAGSHGSVAITIARVVEQEPGLQAWKCESVKIKKRGTAVEVSRSLTPRAPFTVPASSVLSEPFILEKGGYVPQEAVTILLAENHRGEASAGVPRTRASEDPYAEEHTHLHRRILRMEENLWDRHRYLKFYEVNLRPEERRRCEICTVNKKGGRGNRAHRSQEGAGSDEGREEQFYAFGFPINEERFEDTWELHEATLDEEIARFQRICEYHEEVCKVIILNSHAGCPTCRGRIFDWHGRRREEATFVGFTSQGEKFEQTFWQTMPRDVKYEREREKEPEQDYEMTDIGSDSEKEHVEDPSKTVVEWAKDPVPPDQKYIDEVSVFGKIPTSVNLAGLGLGALEQKKMSIGDGIGVPDVTSMERELFATAMEFTDAAAAPVETVTRGDVWAKAQRRTDSAKMKKRDRRRNDHELHAPAKGPRLRADAHAEAPSGSARGGPGGFLEGQ